MSTLHVEGPREEARFTRQEAEAFMRSWYRVADKRGATVAYAPDAVTAQGIVAAPDLVAALDRIDEYATRQCAEKTDEGALWAQCAGLARAALARTNPKARGGTL